MSVSVVYVNLHMCVCMFCVSVCVRVCACVNVSAIVGSCVHVCERACECFCVRMYVFVRAYIHIRSKTIVIYIHITKFCHFYIYITLTMIFLATLISHDFLSYIDIT